MLYKCFVSAGTALKPLQPIGIVKLCFNMILGHFRANRERSHCVGLMLAQCRRRWHNIKPAQGHRCSAILIGGWVTSQQCFMKYLSFSSKHLIEIYLLGPTFAKYKLFKTESNHVETHALKCLMQKKKKKQ